MLARRAAGAVLALFGEQRMGKGGETRETSAQTHLKASPSHPTGQS